MQAATAAAVAAIPTPHQLLVDLRRRQFQQPMNATRDGGPGGAGGGSGRRAHGLWLGAAATVDKSGQSPETTSCNPRRKITFARLATCVLNVERARRKTVSLLPFPTDSRRLSASYPANEKSWILNIENVPRIGTKRNAVKTKARLFLSDNA